MVPVSGAGGRPNIGVIGASARAAVMSLHRAGHTPWAVDLFADRDLCRLARTRRCPMHLYPQGLVDHAADFPPGPCLYTGGLENFPRIIADLAQARPLWGNPPEVLAKVRDPFWLADTLARQGLPIAPVLPGYSPVPPGRWLRKRLGSSGGLGVRFASASGDSPRHAEGTYLQQFLPGPSLSAVFFSDEARLNLLGVCEQLIGEGWLGASGFLYCGNLGPITPPAAGLSDFRRIGQTLHQHAGIRGLWGVDAILYQGRPVLIEVNPRYPASVEVLELAFQRSAWADLWDMTEPGKPEGAVGKGVVFAPGRIVFPGEGPWEEVLLEPFAPWRVPRYADIPAAGEVIEAGQPVLTVLVTGQTIEQCRGRLQSEAREVLIRLGWQAREEVRERDDE